MLFFKELLLSILLVSTVQAGAQGLSSAAVPGAGTRPSLVKGSGVRAIVFELANEGQRRGSAWLMPKEIPGHWYHGVGIDRDLTARWSVGLDVLFDMRSLYGSDQGRATVYDPDVVVHSASGAHVATGLNAEYRQTGSVFGLNTRVLRRLLPAASGSPYLGAWVGFRREHIVLDRPEHMYSADTRVVLSNGPSSRLTSTSLRVPVGLRLGFDLRAGGTYFDLYLYGAYQFGGGKEYFDGPYQVTVADRPDLLSKDDHIAFRSSEVSYGVGCAFGIGRRL